MESSVFLEVYDYHANFFDLANFLIKMNNFLLQGAVLKIIVHATLTECFFFIL